MSIAIKWIFAFVLVLTLFPVDALRCYSCDSLCNCLQPSTTECGLQTQCYTVKKLSDGKVTRKGCTADCNMVNDFNSMCTLCRGSNCNSETSLTPMSSPYDECRNDQGGLGQHINQPNQPNQGGLGQQTQGIGGLGQQTQGIGGLGQSAGIRNPGDLGQNINQPQLGPSPNQLNYQPAPSLGNTDANTLGQRFGDENQLGQKFRNSAVRNGFNLLAVGAAFFGLNRM